MLINKRKRLNFLNDSKAFIEYSNDMDDIYKNIEESNPNKQRKILIVFYDIIAQGRGESTSSVAFEILIINCQIYFINSFIFNCLKFNIKLFIFKLFDVKFLFSENHVFRKQKRTAVYGLVPLALDFKLTRENDDLLSSRYK